MKPLYLDADERVRLQLDGPSLVVISPSSAARRFPFSRLSRVVICGPVEVETQALVECLRHGIAVTFLASDGAPAGTALPAQLRPSRFEQRLEEFLERPNWREAYDNWRRAAERREILAALRRLGLRARDLRPNTVDLLLGEELEARCGRSRREEAVAWLRGLVASLVHERLVAVGVAPELVAGRRPDFHLAADLTALMLWMVKAELVAALAAQALIPADRERPWRRQLTAWFEERRARESHRAGRLLDGFSYWLGGVR
ncbi:MAG: CRISPR-associated endonuclease Cas1 [Bryobacterales bacterium]|nr:CRISPR-associated endonuclease Cas1 [Bryobacteraceae bacterium]MDW8354306.1 CRISPR-associated endonuclease Cas1 [Bryobacterales bacterium]